ncbi:MAG TPA: UDP-N-acetylenolpyruvoylglucosamine reductase [Bacteroidales bacterium]|nr:MAG: UDP-N-acetylenolpyruvoylglucosamine reductase [Bacteroidetes bacterium GWF2_33_38]OFY72391.1 MAG: UDP-N-acetylenolpyruvoylglucosamine reductase [Bacteroidetes bacterium RIFOXYA12_FULL_33_9]OFY89804.1 MAG: UDP-N-acetylenolpyruvoylglucosamine reductase [Bacteroidetes bacterium RIFOXYA2_FULL_33_7]HBF89107.1 UDP-N-acetylenolpyruvoylglucosamine reductase [Bacteroidales bacterium]
MHNVHANFDLTTFNTFGIKAHCDYYIPFTDVSKLRSIIYNDKRLKSLPNFVLGGGSNILFTKNFNGLILHPLMNGLEKVNEDNDFVWIKAGSGVVWDDFVQYAVENNYGGVENLSLIPGNVGACPVQNIGAYGVEAKDVIDKVYAVKISDFSTKLFSNAECKFDYRDSIFKNKLKGQYFITNVTFKLSKKHKLVTNYGKVDEELKKYQEQNIQSVRNAIIAIRREKLPDPKEIGNAGSFFKNPIIDQSKAEQIKQEFPTIVLYSVDSQQYKVVAGWLIEQCGWKGKQINHVGVHKNQALVLVNHGKATGNEILELSNNIQESVMQKFGIQINPEVNIL